MRTSLIIAPHPDDEILSFGGYLISEINKNNNVFVTLATCGGPNSKASSEVREEEFNNVMDFIGVPKENRIILYRNMDGCLDTIPTSNITREIDILISNIRPDNIMTCYPSTHGDHIALYNSFMASMRLKEGFMPSLVAFGEYPFILPSLHTPEGGKLYLPLTEETFLKKCKAFELYKSQQRKSPSPLGLEGIRILSETRGLSCGYQFAEMYYVSSLVKRIV